MSPWWAQSITVRFEQETGRRIPGETCEGTYQANVSKTISGNVEEVFAKWTDRYSSYTLLNRVKLKSNATTSVTHKWRYWRVKLLDGFAISINFLQKERDKIIILCPYGTLM